MSENIRIAVDAMGGDHGPSAVIPGCALALERNPGVTFQLFGDEMVIAPYLDQHPELKAASKIIHTEVAISMDAKPSQALRHGRRKSSMWLALDAVRQNEADFAISAGNTGALMALSKFGLRTMSNVERPALAALWPTVRGESVVLDLGATIGADAWQLVDFAVMGEAMAKALLGVEKPSVGLLNIGVEEVKGVEEVRAAGQLLRRSGFPINYHGFVEGDDIGQGTVDVVVTEGFTGNIALKAAEGTAKQFGSYLRSAMSRSLLTKLGALLARSAFEQLKKRMDPGRANGAVFLGLNGIVVKSHGGANAAGYAHAVDIGIEVARFGLLEHIAKGLEDFRSRRPDIEIEDSESGDKE